MRRPAAIGKLWWRSKTAQLHAPVLARARHDLVMRHPRRIEHHITRLEREFMTAGMGDATSTRMVDHLPDRMRMQTTCTAEAQFMAKSYDKYNGHVKHAIRGI
jgi:hypothetical protein